ncbi:MAG TPA: hypothetical protein VHV56_01640 [Pseudolabrys sp.]|nr:hypothetical protein [Pseudolabrys sp.]
MKRIYLIFAFLAATVLGFSTVPSRAAAAAIIVAAGSAGDGQVTQQLADNNDSNDDDEKRTPEQKMQDRFPQPVRVGDLLGLPVLDYNDSTIGYVHEVVRSPQGKIFLIVPYSAHFGWARTEWGKRPVAVPIEVVAILARQLDALDMSRDDFDKAPTWKPSQGQRIPSDEKTLIALARR